MADKLKERLQTSFWRQKRRKLRRSCWALHRSYYLGDGALEAVDSATRAQQATWLSSSGATCRGKASR